MRFKDLSILGMLLGILLVLGSWGIVYVALHFVLKYW